VLLVTLMLLARLGANIQLSVDLTVNEYTPPVVGLPEIAPAWLMLRPGGKEPVVMLYTIGAWLPVV
jgi:hypothetical protein